MPTPLNIHYLYIIVWIDREGTSWELRDDIRDAVDEYLAENGLEGEYAYYDFANHVHVGSGTGIHRSDISSVKIGIARFKGATDEGSHELVQERDERQWNKEREFMQQWLLGVAGVASDSEIHEICDKYLVKDPQIDNK